MNRRAAAFWVLLVVLLLAVGLVSGRQAQVGQPLDPDGTDELGTAALVDLLGEYGVDVERGLPGADTGTTLVVADRMGEEQRRQLDRWVRAGGTLVVTDPSSPFAPLTDPFEPIVVSDELAGSCRIGGGRAGPEPTMAGLTLVSDTFLLYPTRPLDPGDLDNPLDPLDADGDDGGGPPFTAGPFEVDERCFSRFDGDWLQVARRGGGRVIALGGALALTNRYLDEGDNAVLAVELLAAGGDPADERMGRVNVIYDPIVSPGTRTLGDLIPRSFVGACWGLVLAFGLFVWWKARRFGRPVPEPQPVELPASLLVRAAGELRRRSGGHPEAAALLRADLAHRLRLRLRVPPDAPGSELASRAATVGGVDPALVTRTLTGPPVTTGGELAALVADIDRVNRAVLDHDRARPGPTTTGSGADGPAGGEPGPVPSHPSAPSPAPVGAAGEPT